MFLHKQQCCDDSDDKDDKDDDNVYYSYDKIVIMNITTEGWALDRVHN